MAGYDADIKTRLSVEDDATPKLKEMQKQLGQMTKQIGSLGTAVKGAQGYLGTFAKSFASAFTVQQITQFVKGSIDLADELLTTAQNLGMTVEEFTSLKYAAQVSGVEFDNFKQGLTRFVDALSSAQDPTSVQARLFKELGFSIKDSNGNIKSAGPALKEFADKFAQIKDPADKVRAAIDLFGKESGPKFVEFLDQGAAAIGQLQIKAQELGVVLDTETAKAAKDANDEISTLGSVVSISAASATKELIPALVAIVKGLTESSSNGSAMTIIFRVLTGVLKGTAIVVGFLGTRLYMVGKQIGGWLAIFNAIAHGDMKAANQIYNDMSKEVDGVRQSWSKFYDQLTNAQPIVKQNNQETANGTKNLGDYGKAADEAAKKRERLNTLFSSAQTDLIKERDLVGDLSKAEQIRVETIIGKYKELEPWQKRKLIDLASEVDITNRLKDAMEVYTKTAIQLQNDYAQNVARTTVELQDQEDILAQMKSGASGADIEEMRRNQQATQSYKERKLELESIISIQKELISVIQKNGDTSPETKKALNDAIKAKDAADAELAALNQLAPILEKRRKENEKNLQYTRDNTKELESWNELIGDASKETEKFNYQWELLDKWLAEGVINLGQYINLQDKLMEQGNQAVEINKEASDKITEFWKAAAQSMQGAMSDFFFDVMQGNMSDLVGNFKKTIDRMVADLLASQLMTYLFGTSFGKGGNIGGVIGNFFGGFRAEGGGVRANTSYVVGEKGPELFTPTTNGNITPNNSLGSVVNINISALDGADVMKVLHGSRKQITEMVTGSRLAYNMR